MQKPFSLHFSKQNPRSSTSIVNYSFMQSLWNKRFLRDCMKKLATIWLNPNFQLMQEKVDQMSDHYLLDSLLQ